MAEFVILNLSDLHIQCDNLRQEAVLKQLVESLKSFVEECVEWRPDFIILPGDVVDSSGGSYEKAKDFLARMKGACLIEEDFRIIMAPGNHDKTRVGIDTKDTFEKMLDNLDLFCDSPRNHLTEFSEIHGKCFEAFNVFYKEYCAIEEKRDDVTYNKEFRYIPYDFFDGTNLEYLSGIKIFEKEKICFLSLNTAWVDTTSSLMVKPKYKGYRAGGNIVAYLTNEIASHYPDFLIITLMHHSPDTLSWEELYDTEPNQKEYTFGNILRYSDLIVSGHEHCVSTGAPDLLRNCVQHFRLGTPSCLPTGGTSSGNTFPFSISLMKLNTVKEEVALLRIPYIPNGKEGVKEWDFQWKVKKRQVETYKLRNKYEKMHRGPFVEKTLEAQIVRVKDYSCAEIETRIKRYLLYDDVFENAVELDIRDIDTVNWKELKKCSLQKQKTLHFVFYKRYNPDLPFQIADGQKKFEEITREMANEIYQRKLVISYIIVQKPYDYLNEVFGV